MVTAAISSESSWISYFASKSSVTSGHSVSTTSKISKEATGSASASSSASNLEVEPEEITRDLQELKEIVVLLASSTVSK